MNLDPTTEASVAAGRIPSLDGLRAIAIILVLIGHGGYSLPLAFQNTYLDNGGLGVRIFFVLSGFLIYTLSSREINRSNSFNVRNFYLRRVIRIFPAFYSYLFLIALLSWFGYLSVKWQSFICAGTFTMNVVSFLEILFGVSSLAAWVVAHYWTLAVEEQFYISWPFIVWLKKRNYLFIAMIGVMFAGPILRIAVYLLFPSLRPSIGFLLSYDAIAGGVLLGVMCEQGYVFRKGDARCTVLMSRNLTAIVSALFVFILVGSPMLNSQFKGFYRLPFGQTLEIVAIMTLISLLIVPSKTWYFQLLNARWLVWIGVLSYSLYLYNMLFLDESRKDWITQFPQNFILLFVFASASYFLIEKPFFRFRKNLRSPAKATS